MALSVTGCVNQHPEETGSTNANESGEVRLVATSPGGSAGSCNRLNLDLVGICQSTSELPERVLTALPPGMAMNRIWRSLNPLTRLHPRPQLSAKTTCSPNTLPSGSPLVFKPQKA